MAEKNVYLLMIKDKTVDIVSLDTYRQFANSDETELALLIKETIRSLEYFQDTLKEAFDNADYARMKASSHSVASELFYLKATNLKSLLKIFLATEENAIKNTEGLFQILSELEDVLQYLKQNIKS
ncbi:MAG TPA: hypothetical protein VIM65_08285 [Cyclobacteriaceae bacterium]